MRITIDIQSEDIKEALEAHIKNQLNIDASVDVDWLNGRYGVTVSLGDAPAYVSDVVDTDKSVTKTEPVKRTRRSKEQIEADRLAEWALNAPDTPESRELLNNAVALMESQFAQDPDPDPETGEIVEPSESGLMATIFAEEPEVEEVVQDIFAVEDNSVFAQPATENVFAIK